MAAWLVGKVTTTIAPLVGSELIVQTGIMFEPVGRLNLATNVKVMQSCCVKALAREVDTAMTTVLAGAWGGGLKLLAGAT